MFKNQGLRQNMLIIYIVFGLVLIAIIFPILNASVTRMEEDLISSRLVADIHYIEDLIGAGDWNIKDGSICRGDVVVGDGTQEKANLDPFLLHEEKTGTFAYVFIRCGDEGLGYVESTPTQAGYQQGHFLRVAGSTKDPNGNSIVGTYMDKIVADILDKEDVYDGEANVAGGMIFCRYETLKNAGKETIGAIVVGRSITELKAQINKTNRSVLYAGLAAIIIGSTLLLLIMNRWVTALQKSTHFLGRIKTGDIPEERLLPRGLKEVDILNQGINSLADTLKENEELRIKSETDQLTGLANRFGLNRFGDELFDTCVREQRPLAMGVMDIDSFKLYNDNYGHQEGDECISKVAQVLHAVQEPGKIMTARYGGDEFIVLASDMDQHGLMQLADRIRNGVMELEIPHAFSKTVPFVTVSQGYYVAVPEEGQSLSFLLAMADRVMYEVKNGSRNNYKIKTQGDAAAAAAETPQNAHADDIEWSTYHDYLTQLLNREGFFLQVPQILQKNPEEEYYLIRSNIREFKLVNQLFGYDKGNEILIDTGEMLRSGSIPAEAAARIQGDHFAMLVKKADFNEDIIRESFAGLSQLVTESPYVLQYHLGVYPIKDKSMDVSIMCDRAKLAINSIQNESSVVIAYYDDSMMENILWENVVITEFESALKTGRFRVFLQPIFDREKNLVGAEALARWLRDQDETVVSPEAFIGILEKTGLIHKLDALVWEESARILQRWKGTALENLSISVNVSPQDDRFLDIEQEFLRLTKEYGIQPHQLNPEFTETTLISDTRRYVKLVSTLQQRGFHVEIDDFGSGYSSLNMLQDIKADVLKLDRLFVSGTENKDRNLSILASVIEMAKKLNMQVVAEGVETESQFLSLAGLGCEYFQGYYFSVAIPPEEFESRYTS